VPGIAPASTALVLVFAAQPALFAAPQTHVELVVGQASAAAAVPHTVAAAVSAAPRIRLVVSSLVVSRSRQLALGLVKQPGLVPEKAVFLPLFLAVWAAQVSRPPKGDLAVLAEV
jgi:hypothetical protein